MNKFFEKTGPMAMATRMRLLSEKMAKDAQDIYDLYNQDLKAKWYPVIFCLMNDEKINTVTSLACHIGQSHVAIVKIVKELISNGIIYEKRDSEDGRKTNLYLSSKGKQIAQNLELQHLDVTNAMEEMLRDTQHNLWKALNEFEDILEEESAYSRVVSKYRKREASKIQIVNYEDKYQEAFECLNKDWIDEFFSIEQTDKEVLANPKEKIIKNGGIVLMALYENSVVGTCSLIKHENSTYVYELSKMAVAKKYQNRGIGIALGEAIIKKAKQLNANSILIETNTVLKNAIALYKKLGFEKIEVKEKSYFRTNYKMQMILEGKKNGSN